MSVQIVGYFEDHVTYEYGPFVLCNPLGSGWRIEAEIKDHHCPAMPDLSIYRLVESVFGDANKSFNYEKKAAQVRYLNDLVAKKEIILKGRIWVAPDYS